MFVFWIFAFIFGLFGWLVYGSKKLIEGVEKEYELVEQVQTYDISDKQYWRSFDTIMGVFFIFMGLLFIWMFLSNLPRNNSALIVMVGSFVLLLFFGLAVLLIYPNYRYRILTKNRPVTFDPIHKMMGVRETDGERIFSVNEIEKIIIHAPGGRIDVRYWEMKLKSGETLLFDPRFWMGMVTEKFFEGVPQESKTYWIPWFRHE
ncbi:hypothetical protein FHS57_001393 [Runella defluvii]|uniref:PH domain-containing protein n=1 Tax=Runella defluvii TaxID=370973 RepID=A0A7W5ZIB1_9BACT|nr:hypothetical protein [Runella defluvii]MBB3837399.1 hypothetical protein [Runella defluvii]